MFKKRLINRFIGLLICLIFIFCNVVFPTYALAYEGVRDDVNGCDVPTDPSRSRPSDPCYIVNFDNVLNKCEVGTITFSAMLPLNRDIEWELFPLPGNQYCMVFVSVHVALLVAAGIYGRFACAATGLSSALSAGTAIPGIGPQNLINQILLANLCVASIAQCASTGATCATVGPCCGAAASYAVILAAAVVELAIIFAVAKDFFHDSQICGNDWKGWKKETFSGTEEMGRDKKWEVDKGPYRKCIENVFIPNSHGTYPEKSDQDIRNEGIVRAKTNCATSSAKEVSNKAYREYIFGGMEYEDNGSNACKNPWNSSDRMKILGYDSPNQRYYFSGSGEGSAPNFACYRFLQKTSSDPTGQASQNAYDCCVNRSQDVLCVETRASAVKNSSYKFCENNSKCDLNGVTFEVYYGKRSANYLCAKSYSVCPYNQAVAGGTEIAKYDDHPEYTDVKLNFCQHLNHCWKAPLQPTIRSSEFSGNFISSACYDMKGDSQNTFQYNAGQLPISTRHFTAPLVQCFKETMENVFLNKAGRNICRDPAFNSKSDCGGEANILYKAGTDLPQDQSFFKKIQDNYRLILKMILTISLMMVGISTLLAVPKAHLEKKVIMTYILKFGLVMYFALGDGWQLSFANAVLNTSSIMSEITFRPNIYDGNPAKIDGCHFPRYNYNSIGDRDYSVQAYPPGKEYLRIWDTLDCKIIRALGFGANISVPNIFLIIVAGFFSSALGVIFFVATFVFGFMLLSIAIRAMHIFLISTSAIIILLFISPITITMVMFERTKKTFENWWKQLLGYALQPVILFIYISILLTVIDYVLIGSANYNGVSVKIEKDKRYQGMTEIDSQNAIDNFGFIAEKTVDCSVNNASNDSIYCIFNMSKFGKLSGFDAIGIGFPVLTNLNKEKIETIAKAGLIMFIFLNFIDTLTFFSSKLVGGSDVNSNWNVKTSRMVKGMNDLMRGIQKRGMRAIAKHAPTIARGGISFARGAVALANGRSQENNKSNARAGADGSTAGDLAGANTAQGSPDNSGAGTSPANPPAPPPPAPPVPPPAGDQSAVRSQGGEDFTARLGFGDLGGGARIGGDFTARSGSGAQGGGDRIGEDFTARSGGAIINGAEGNQPQGVAGTAPRAGQPQGVAGTPPRAGQPQGVAGTAPRAGGPQGGAGNTPRADGPHGGAGNTPRADGPQGGINDDENRESNSPDLDSDTQGDQADDDSTQNFADGESSAGSSSVKSPNSLRSGRANGILKKQGAFGRGALRSKSPAGSKVTFQGSAGSSQRGSGEGSNQISAQESKEGLRQNLSSNFQDSRSQDRDPQRMALGASLGQLGGKLQFGEAGKMMQIQAIPVIPETGDSNSNSPSEAKSGGRRVRIDESRNEYINPQDAYRGEVARAIEATRPARKLPNDGWTPVTLLDSTIPNQAKSQAQVPAQAKSQAQSQSKAQVQAQSPATSQGPASVRSTEGAQIIDAGGGVRPQKAMGPQAGSDPKSRIPNPQRGLTSQAGRGGEPKATQKPVDEFGFEEDDDSDDDNDSR